MTKPCLKLPIVILLVVFWTPVAFAQFDRTQQCIDLSGPWEMNNPPQGKHLMMTDPNSCDMENGQVKLVLDDYGSTGSSTSGGLACFDPFDDRPDDRLRSTIFESMAFLCRTSGADVQGEWLEGSSQSGGVPVVRVVDGEVFSDFNTVGLRVEGRFRLNCSILEKCYTVTNTTGAEMQTVALTHYMDGDLFFRAGNLSDDFGATSDGAPKTLWQFEEGDIGVDGQPATFVGMYALGGGNEFLQSWEVGSFPDQK
ncbi:MAG: hypothetical protein VX589_00580, partial [Myxococcota bacterium]|nr:hypothetical protein [Myxococcota bacterium]